MYICIRSYCTIESKATKSTSRKKREGEKQTTTAHPLTSPPHIIGDRQTILQAQVEDNLRTVFEKVSNRVNPPGPRLAIKHIHMQN